MSNISPVISLRLNWSAEYHGPNPCAHSAVVVAELAADLLPSVEQVSRACEQLWYGSGMVASKVETPGSRTGQDHQNSALLVLGRTATAWAKAALNEVRGFVQHAGAEGGGDVMRLWVGFHHAELSRAALQLALRTLAELMNGCSSQARLKADLEQLWQACRRYHPDFQARILMGAARDMDVPFMPFLAESRDWQFGWGTRSRVFFETASNADGALGWRWQRNKVTSKELMRSLGMPTPGHVLVRDEADLSHALARVGVPCVVKPLDSGGGKGVTANIRDDQSLRLAFREARRYSVGPLLVEQHLAGTDYRLMVVDGQLVAALQREASCLVGDGLTSLGELLRRLNSTRFENLARSCYLRPIKIDDVLTQHLQGQGVDLDSVLPHGRAVSLRSNANRSTGGISTDVTDRLHPQVRAMAEQLAKVMGLRAAGIDYLTLDIAQDPWSSGGGFIEINATPGMAVFVAAGWSEEAIGRVLLGEGLGRIPVTLTIVSRDRLPQALELLQSRQLEETQGWVCGKELRVGAAALFVKGLRPWEAVGAALRNPCLQRLELVCTGEDIERDGLPVDRFQAVNIQDRTLEQSWIRVLECACEGELRP